jgi:4-hydroxy-4-methyl-2-oxoglutarate aldolase
MVKPNLETLIKVFKQTYPAAVCDILECYDLWNQWLGPEFKPLSPESRVAGPAFTMRWINDPVPLGEEGKAYIADLVNHLEPLMVPVIDSGNCPDAGYWGELMCNLCLRKGIDSAVIYGGVRDPYYIYKLGFNMFYTFICPHEANHRSQLESYQKPILINGVTINPGDFIVGDLGGLVVIPKGILYDVFEKVQEVIAKENTSRQMILDGATVEDIIATGNI